MAAHENGTRRSFTSTGFLVFLASWGSNLTAMLTAVDPVVRHWGAAGMVCLPALYLICSTLIKRMRLKRDATLGARGALAAPVRLAAPAAPPPPLAAPGRAP